MKQRQCQIATNCAENKTAKWCVVRHRPTVVERLQDHVPETSNRPSPELAVNAGPFAELSGQVAPLGPGAGNAEHTVENLAMIAGRPPTTSRIASINPSKNAHSASSINNRAKIASPERYLESDLTRFGNPLCQQRSGLRYLSAPEGCDDAHRPAAVRAWFTQCEGLWRNL